MLEHIPEPSPGDDIDAEWGALVAQRLNREFTGENYYEDEFGVWTGGGGGAETLVRSFELKDNLTAGGSATAYLRTWNGSAYVTDTDTEFEVYDALDTFSGTARDEGPPIVAGNWGYAQMLNGRWEIIQLSCDPGGS